MLTTLESPKFFSARTGMLICNFGDFVRALGIACDPLLPFETTSLMTALYQKFREMNLGNVFIDTRWDGIFIGMVNAKGQAALVADLEFPFPRHRLLSVLRNIRHQDAREGG